MWTNQELKEKANNYAEEKVINILKEALAKVYADGYRDGYKDCEDEITTNLQDDETEFVDLGLPSGTLWAKEYEKTGDNFLYLPYFQAKGYNLPTRTQWEELVKYCKWGWCGKVFRCTGRNGGIIDFPKTGKIDTTFENGGNAYLWLLEESLDDENNAYAYIYNATPQDIGSCFMGYRLPIRQVKVK